MPGEKPIRAIALQGIPEFRGAHVREPRMTLDEAVYRLHEHGYRLVRDERRDIGYELLQTKSAPDQFLAHLRRIGGFEREMWMVWPPPRTIRVPVLAQQVSLKDAPFPEPHQINVHTLEFVMARRLGLAEFVYEEVA